MLELQKKKKKIKIQWRLKDTSKNYDCMTQNAPYLGPSHQENSTIYIFSANRCQLRFCLIKF